jgi:hypothetical protein
MAAYKQPHHHRINHTPIMSSRDRITNYKDTAKTDVQSLSIRFDSNLGLCIDSYTYTRIVNKRNEHVVLPFQTARFDSI